MFYKYTYPSIEYVLATGHYPEPCRKNVRHHPTFFSTPPVQVFHIAHGHIPVFLPLPPSYSSSRLHSRSPSEYAAATFQPRNRSFTVTVPHSVANKKLPTRNSSSEPSPPNAGTSAMIMNIANEGKDKLLMSNVHYPSDSDVETMAEGVGAAISAHGDSPDDVSNKTTMSESISYLESDNETRPVPVTSSKGTKQQGEDVSQDSTQVYQVSRKFAAEDEDSVYKRIGSSRARHRAMSYSHLQNQAGTSGSASRNYTSTNQQGIRVN